MVHFDFGNKVAVVTGAGGGIGLAISRRILAAGGSVLMLDIKSQPADLDTNDRTIYTQGDLTDAAFVNNAIEEAATYFGHIDYLVNTAGVLWFDRDASLLEMDLDVWDRVLNINLKSMVHTARATVPHLRKAGGGSMVHFSTIQCLRGDYSPQDAYAAAKSGVSTISKSLAMQLAKENIRSNTIFPGLIATPMQSRWDTQEKTSVAGGGVPLGRVGTPKEVANAALFLLSDASSYITGIDLIVDGGVLLKY